MADMDPQQPYVIWGLGAALAAAGGFIRYLFGIIKSNRDDARAVAEAVRLELHRAQADWDNKLEAMRTTAAQRWSEGREDHSVLRSQVQENYRNVVEQHERMVATMANLPSVIVALLRDRGDH